ncbi:hypothetical protein ASG23_06735 [Cellulomonas sp. Leaf395]|nr:hypothetical protein ASG23_06735 [Cellulomonas sp. Leaf395]
MRAVDTALTTGGTHAVEVCASLHDRHPNLSPDDVRRLVERRYMATVTTSGAAAGAIAIAPVAAGVGAAVLDAIGFIGLSVRLVLIEAALAGDPLDDQERLRTLALAALVGKGAHDVIREATKRTGTHLGAKAAKAIPLETIRAINKVLGRNFVTRYGTRQGILVLGKALPAGIGAVLGAGGNAALGASVIKGAHVFCGPAVQTWDDVAVNLGAEADVADFSNWRRPDDGSMPAAA